MLSWPNIYCYFYWKGCDRKLSRLFLVVCGIEQWQMLIPLPNLGALWIGTDVIWCCLDQIYCDVHAVCQQSTARRWFTAVAMQRNNRAAVFSLRSLPTVIGKLFRTLGNGVARQTLYQQATIPANRNRRQCFLCGPFTGYIFMSPVQSDSQYSAREYSTAELWGQFQYESSLESRRGSDELMAREARRLFYWNTGWGAVASLVLNSTEVL
jgi:hypothetical protein